MHNVQSNTAVNESADEPNQMSLLAQMLMSSSAHDELKSPGTNLTLDNVDEDTIEELVILHKILSL